MQYKILFNDTISKLKPGAVTPYICKGLTRLIAESHIHAYIYILLEVGGMYVATVHTHLLLLMLVIQN